MDQEEYDVAAKAKTMFPDDFYDELLAMELEREGAAMRIYHYLPDSEYKEYKASLDRITNEENPKMETTRSNVLTLRSNELIKRVNGSMISLNKVRRLQSKSNKTTKFSIRLWLTVI